MKKLVYIVVFLIFAAESFAQTGLEINGTFYASGSTYTLSCGSGIPVSVRGKFQGSYVYCSSSPSYPSGWSKTGSEAMGCPIYTANANGGGAIQMKLYNISGQQLADVVVNIPRPVPSLSLSGPGQICSNQTPTYTLSTGTTPSGTTNWTTGSFLSRTGANGGLSTQISRTGNGASFVKAEFTNTCGTYQVQQVVNAGTPVISYPNLWLFDPGSNMYQFSHSTFGTTFSYSVSSGSATLQQNGNDCYITTTTGATVCANMTNPCGSGSYCFYVPGTGGMRVYPNPAKGKVLVDFGDLKSVEGLPSEIYLYSEKSPVVPVKKISLNNQNSLLNGNSIGIDVENLPKGTYYLHSIPKKGVHGKSERIKVILN